ncbi:MAG: glycosyltransferase, partial [Myxococcota bacterium]
MSEDKGVMTLLEALTQVRKRTDFRMTFVGGGMEDYVAKMHTFVQEHELAAQVHFAGRVPYAEVSRFMTTHDILIFPSAWPEPFGLSHLEALASGMFVVGTAVGGIRELLEVPDVYMKVFPPGDAEACAEALCSLVDDQDQERPRFEASTHKVRAF